MWNAMLWVRRRRWLAYAVAVALCFIGLGARFAIGPILFGAPFITYFPAIILAAFMGGTGPGLVAIALTVLLANEHIIADTRFAVYWPEGWILLFVFSFITACVVMLINATIKASQRYRQTLDLLQTANETLESRIAERTAELLAAEEKLRQSQKMDAIGQLTNGIAHDFNNLLTGITGSLELVQTRIAQGRAEGLGRYVSAALESAQRAASLTDRLLAFSRRQPLAPSTIRLDTQIQSIMELVRRSIGPGVKILYRPTAADWAVYVDPNQFEHALLNLCINASDAMRGAGTLTLETKPVTLDDAQARALELAPGDYVLLNVTDTGSGMPPEVVRRAFEPFFTTKPVGEGTGLGLSMVHGFAAQSGGAALIQSVPAHGTTIRLYLPRRQGPMAPPQATPAAIPTRPVPTDMIILVVDDEATIRMLLVDLLADLGFAPLEAADGPRALKLLKSDRRIDLLITDIGMPGMNGRELVAAARALRPELRILFITGYGETGLTAHETLPDEADILRKPFTLGTVAERIGEILDGGTRRARILGESDLSL